MNQSLAESPRPMISRILGINPCAGSPKGGRRRFWTTQENAILREWWPRGIVPTLVHLPGRTAAACYAHAGKLSLLSREKVRTGLPRRRYQYSGQADEIIRRRYPEAATRRGVALLARDVGVSEESLKNRALKLGLTRMQFKEAPWSEREDEILLTNAALEAHRIALKLKRCGYHRTPTAIVVRLKRRHVNRSDPNCMTARECARLLGIDSHGVGRMISDGLRAKRRGTARVESQGGDEWLIRRADLRKFVAANPSEIDVRKVDGVWFIDLLAGAPE